MKRAPIYLACMTALLGGCLHDPQQGTPTLRELSQRTVPTGTDASATAPSKVEVISAYQAYLTDAPEGTYKVQALRRLADLHMEAQEQAGEPDVAAYREAARRYRDLLARYPDAPDNDVVLYQLAKAEDHAGNSDGSLEALSRLTREYRYSRYFAEAQFRRGEALFVRRDYAGAADAYGHLVQSGPGSPFHQQALFKFGWTRFKQARYAESQDSFIDLLDRLLPEQRTLGQTDRETLKDTLRVLSVSFAYLDGHESINAALERKGARPYVDGLYQALGDLYREQGRHHDAANTYYAFVEHQPWHARAPEFLQAAIDTYGSGGFADLALDTKREFADRYGIHSLYWQRHPVSVTAPMRLLLKTHITELARYHHARAQKQKSAADYALAVAWYRNFLEGFNDHPEAAQMNFLLAEALYESGEYADAAREYERTAYGRNGFARGADAGYAAVLAHHAQRDRSIGEERERATEDGIKSALLFSSHYAADPRALPVLTQAADELFTRGDLERSAPLAERVLAAQPEAAPELRRTAYAILAHSRFEKGRYAEAEQHYAAVLQLLPAGDPARGKYGEGLAATIYKQGEQAREAGDHRAAAAHFLRVGERVPDSEFRVTAHYDAAASLMQAKDWTQAADLLEGFRQRYPRHSLASGVPEKLAACYLEQGAHAKAAAELERVVDLRTDQQGRRDAAWQAAELYESAKDETAARRAWERYVTLFAEPLDDAVEARRRIAEYHRTRKEFAAQHKWLRQIVQSVENHPVKDGTRLTAARATLTLAEPAREEFQRLRLSAPLKGSLKKKKEAMQTALKGYERAAAWGIAEVTTAAAYHTAEIYHRFSKDLLASERPRGLSEEEIEQYNVLLEEQAYPFEEQAITLHEVNAARTRDGLYDEWIRNSLQQLAELRPVQYAKLERGEEVDDALE